MRRVARPLEAMGARVSLPSHGGLPMTIDGGALNGIDWSSDVASAQVKSAILLAALVARVSASVTEPTLSRDHTERMLAARGARITSRGTRVELAAGSTLRAVDVSVPSDPSSAAFFAGLTAASDSAEVLLERVCVNPTRMGFFALLSRMGARVTETNRRDEAGEAVADVLVRSGALKGTTVGAADVPAMIDELPLLACLATRASGETIVTGAGELRTKESDRIAAVVANLRAVGATAEELPDGYRVIGARSNLRGRVVTHGDHRLAMAFGILGALPGNEIAVDDPACVGVSYPGFWDDLDRLRPTAKWS